MVGQRLAQGRIQGGNVEWRALQLRRQVECAGQVAGAGGQRGKLLHEGRVGHVGPVNLGFDAGCFIEMAAGLQPQCTRQGEPGKGDAARRHVQATPPAKQGVGLQQFGWCQVQQQGFACLRGQWRKLGRGGEKIIRYPQGGGERRQVDQPRAERRVCVERRLGAVELAGGIEQHHVQPCLARQDALAGEIELGLGDFVSGIAGHGRGCFAADQARKAQQAIVIVRQAQPVVEPVSQQGVWLLDAQGSKQMLAGQCQRGDAGKRYAGAVERGQPGREPVGIGEGGEQVAVVAPAGGFACLPPGTGEPGIAEHLLELAGEQFLAGTALHMRQDFTAVILVDGVDHQPCGQVGMAGQQGAKRSQAFARWREFTQPVHAAGTPVECADLAGGGEEDEAAVEHDYSGRLPIRSYTGSSTETRMTPRIRPSTAVSSGSSTRRPFSMESSTSRL